MRNKHRNPYSKLSRKELQNLCKKYGLSAIGPTPHLARSLFSFFKEKNLHPQLARNRHGDGRETNSVSKQINLESERRSNCLEATNDGDKTSLQISNGEDCGPDNSFVGKTTEMMCFPTILPVQTRCMDALHSDMATDIFDIGRSKDGLICSTLVTRAADLPASVSADSDAVLCSTVIDDVHLNDESHIPTKESHGQLPSFQFFTESKDGINIYIDLSSSPSHWIKSLKDEVHLFQAVPLEALHGVCDEPMSMTYAEAGSIYQKHEKKNNNHPVQMVSIAPSIDNSANLPVENSAKTTLVRQIENDSSSLVCDNNSTQQKSSSIEGREIQVVADYSYTRTYSSDLKSSVTQSKCLDTLESSC